MIYESCGTPRGFLVHYKAGEMACEDCLYARRIYARWWRFATGRQHDLTRCISCGSVFDKHRCGMTLNNSQLFRAEQEA